MINLSNQNPEENNNGNLIGLFNKDNYNIPIKNQSSSIKEFLQGETMTKAGCENKTAGAEKNHIDSMIQSIYERHFSKKPEPEIPVEEPKNYAVLFQNQYQNSKEVSYNQQYVGSSNFGSFGTPKFGSPTTEFSPEGPNLMSGNLFSQISQFPNQNAPEANQS